MSRKVLIGGGSGFIGTALKEILENRGYVVTVISRTAGKDQITWDDIRDVGIPDDTDVVINLAGENILNMWRIATENFKKTVIDSRVNTTSLLANAINNAKKKPEVFISMSGIGIYGPGKDETYDEYSAVGESFDFISKLVLEWEKASETSEDVRKIILRTGIVLGRRGGIIGNLYSQFFMGFGSWFGSGDQYFSWIHLHDLCRLIVFAIENNQVEGVINGVAPEIIIHRTFAKTFASTLNRPAWFPTPDFLCKLLFGSDRSILLLEGQKIIPRKALEVHKFKYLYPTIQSACEEFAPIRYTPPPWNY